MHIRWRIRFTWTLAILYGFVSAMGEGLHQLPGQAHDACCHRADYCPHDDYTGPVESPGDFGSQVAVGSSRPLHDHDHCAICDFLGQGTWFLRPVAIPDWRFFQGFQRPAKTIGITYRWRHLPFLSRAPPAPVDC